MEPKYVLILVFCVGGLNIIKLTDEELRESENYEDFESFLSTIKERYGFRHLLLSERRRSRTQSVIVKSGRETEVILGFSFFFLLE